MQDINLTRFIDRMAQLITKYADAVDWNELPDPDYEKLNIDEIEAVSQEDYAVMGSCDGDKTIAGTSVSASFFVAIGKCLLNGFYLLKSQNISIFFNIKRLYRRIIESYTIYRKVWTVIQWD